MRLYFTLSILLFLSAPLIKAQQVTFSSQRGLYNSPIQLTLTTDLAGGTIKYTTNGTSPSDTAGDIYSAPLAITTTTVVRAIAISGATTTKVFTHTYIFPNDVILQPDSIPGWPREYYELGD